MKRCMTHWCGRAARAALVLLLVLLCAPRAVLADAPGTRGPRVPLPQGGMQDSTRSTTWQDVTMMFPASGAISVGRYATPGAPSDFPAADPEPPTSDANSSSVSSWLGRKLNFGNWMTDAGLGLGFSMFSTMSESLLGAIVKATGKDTVSLAPTCGNDTINFVFCTPPSLLFGNIGHAGPVIRKIWAALVPITNSLLSLLFMIRLFRVRREGMQNIGRESIELIIDFVITITLVNSSYFVWGSACVAINWFVKTIFSAFGGANLVTMTELMKMTSNPSFGASLTQTIFLGVFLWLVIKGLVRMIKLAVLFSIAPLMGVLYFDRSTRPRFTAWAGRVTDVLLEQVVWTFFIVIGGLFLQYGNGDASGLADAANRTVATILATIIVGMAVGGEGLMAGIAGASNHSLGLGSLVAARALGAGMRGMNGMLRGAGEIAAKGATAGAAGAAGATAGATAAGAAASSRTNSNAVAAFSGLDQAKTEAPTLRSGTESDGALPGQRARAALGLPTPAFTGPTTRLSSLTSAPAKPAFQANRHFSTGVANRLRVEAGKPDVAPERRANLIGKAKLHKQIARRGNDGIAWKESQHSTRQDDGSFVSTTAGQVMRESFKTAQRRVEREDVATVQQATTQRTKDERFLKTGAAAKQHRLDHPRATNLQPVGMPLKARQQRSAHPISSRLAPANRAIRRLNQQEHAAQQRIATNAKTIATLTPGKSALTGAVQPRSMATGQRIRTEGQRIAFQTLAQRDARAVQRYPIERREAPVRQQATVQAERFRTQATQLRSQAVQLRATAQDISTSNPGARATQIAHAGRLEQQADRSEQRAARYSAVATRPVGQVPVPAARGTPTPQQQQRRTTYAAVQQQVSQRHVDNGVRVDAPQMRQETARVARQQLGEAPTPTHVRQVQQRATQAAQTAPVRAQQQASALRSQATAATNASQQAGDRHTQQRFTGQAQQLNRLATRAEARPARYQAVAANPQQALRPLWKPEERQQRKAVYTQTYAEAQRIAAAAPQPWTAIQVRAKAKELAQNQLGESLWSDTRKREQGRS